MWSLYRKFLNALHLISLITSIVISMVYLLQFMSKYLYVILIQSPYITDICLVFALHPFSLHRIPTRIPYYIYSSCFLDSFWLWPSLFLMTLSVLRNIGQTFCRMSLNWNLSDDFLKIMLGLWASGTQEDHRGKTPFSSPCVRMLAAQNDLMTVDVDLHHLSFLHCKLTLPSLSHVQYCTLWKEVTTHSPLKEQSSTFHILNSKLST